MFYNQHVRCQVDYFGYIQVLNNAVQSKLNPETKFVIRGVVDGPIPIPNQNIAGFTFVPGVFNLGQVLCGTTSLKNSSHQSTLAWTLGFQSSGGSNKGAGPAWDISFSSGCGSTTGETESTVTLTQMIQNSIVNRNSESVGIDLVPTGNMFAAPQTITATLYKFYDAQGNLISDATTSTDGQAIKTALIGVYNDPLAAYPYVPFLSAPGWLESYTPEAINAQMDSLLPNLKSPKLIHKRSPPWTNYFQDVICANAYGFVDDTDSGGQKYLSFSWQFDGAVATTFIGTKTTFTENTWTLDTKDYVGVAGGVDVNVFGLGEQEWYQFLAGFTISAKTTTTTTNGNSWGIALSQWGHHHGVIRTVLWH